MPNKLDLNHLRARIDSESRDYAAMRERQQTSRSRWFGERSKGIDEAALTKRLAAPTPKLSQEELELSLNFGDIHLPDHYESPVIYEGSADTLDCAIDTADFSDMAADFMDMALMPPPVNAPVPLIKHQGKGKKGRRARSKEAAKMKNGTRN